jgi:hypothetical protein
MDMVTVYGEPRSLAGVIESGHGNSLGWTPIRKEELTDMQPFRVNPNNSTKLLKSWPVVQPFKVNPDRLGKSGKPISYY